VEGSQGDRGIVAESLEIGHPSLLKELYEKISHKAENRFLFRTNPEQLNSVWVRTKVLRGMLDYENLCVYWDLEGRFK